MPNRLLAATLLTASAALLAACGSSSSSPTLSASLSTNPGNGSTGAASSTAGVDACALIGSDGAKAILGQDVGPAKRTADVPYPNCLYPAVGATNFASVSITIFAGQQATDGLFAGASTLNATVAVPGIGDQALADSTGMVLLARKGATGCTVVLVGEKIPGTPQSRDQAMGAFCAKAFG